jgi:hypothetical protein
MTPWPSVPHPWSTPFIKSLKFEKRTAVEWRWSVLMGNTAEKEFISKTYTNLRDFSFSEKRSDFLVEEKVNKLLDSILELKKRLVDKTERLHTINDGFQKLTWFNTIDEESLQRINDLVSAAKDLHSSFIRQYVAMNLLRKKNIAKVEIKAFKSAVDDLKESYEDLESVFFFLPKMPDFKDTNKVLSLI